MSAPSLIRRRRRRKVLRVGTLQVTPPSTVLDLDSDEAQIFFLEDDSYSSIELPFYFQFSKMLNRIQNVLLNRVLTDGDFKSFKELETANYSIYTNKGDKYSWRKLQLINPILYVKLVEDITASKNWSELQQRFQEFGANSTIECMSIPVLKAKGQTRLGAQITSWLDRFEGESIRLGLKYEYMYRTDISNCYSSMYTHSVAWAIHTKSVSKALKFDMSLLGNRIDRYLQSMSNGQTNGIPEGSVVMDFIAEMILGHGDELLALEITKEGIADTQYQILRYRDDYRIFVHDELIGEQILKILSKNLMGFGMRLNQNKTGKANHIILDSVKPAKLASYDRQKRRIRTHLQLQNELMSILNACQNSADSGHVRSRLMDLARSVEKWRRKPSGHEKEILSILVNIAYEKPDSFAIIAKLVSTFLTYFPNDKDEIFNDILKKMKLMPNSGLVEIWLQRIARPHGIYLSYSESICQLISIGNSIEIFSDSWQVNSSLANLSLDLDFVNTYALKNLSWNIAMEEIAIFSYS